MSIHASVCNLRYSNEIKKNMTSSLLNEEIGWSDRSLVVIDETSHKHW